MIGALCVPIVYFVAALVWYAVRSRGDGAPFDRELAARGRSFLLGHTIRQGFAWSMTPIEAALLRASVAPDTLTVAGCVLCCVGALVLACGDVTVGGMLILGSAAFDFLDGRLARRLGLSTKAGEFLDSTLDRYADAFCFGGAAFFFRDRPWMLAASLTAFGASAIVPYARAKADSLGVAMRSGLMQRPERIVLFGVSAIFGAVLDWCWPASMRDLHPTFASAVCFLAVATAGTAVARTREALRRLRSGD